MESQPGCDKIDADAAQTLADMTIEGSVGETPAPLPTQALTLTTASLARACRIFMELAYPRGIETIPACKRPYFDINVDRPLAEYLLPAERTVGVCQELGRQNGVLRGYEFRLGSAKYSHIKLRVQVMDFHQRDVWVYSVNTHDGFFQATKYLSEKEADDWRELVEHNCLLKHQIEQALALADYLTPKRILQHDLAVQTQAS